MTKLSLTPLGDCAISVRVGQGISVELSERVVAYARTVAVAAIRGVTDVVPSYGSLAVFYDPLAVSFEDLSAHVETLLADASGREWEPPPEGRLIRIPVHYDGEDLEEVARRTKMNASDVAEVHASREYRVFVVGFVPGFAYLGPLDPRLILPRRETPRKRVAPGSVAIAEGQTGVYPSATPGGWHLIGMTGQIMFDANRESPALLRVGDSVRFEIVT